MQAEHIGCCTDDQHDRFATVVSVQLSDRLGELLDTVRAVLCQLIAEQLLVAKVRTSRTASRTAVVSLQFW